MQDTQIIAAGGMNIAGGAQPPLQLNTIDQRWGLKHMRVSQFMLTLHLVVTTGAGGGVTAEEIARWVNNIHLSADGWDFVVDCNAYDLLLLQAVEFGRWLTLMTAGYGANQAAVPYTLRIPMLLNSPNAVDPQDAFPFASAFRDGMLTWTTGPAAINANTTLQAGSAYQLSCSLQPKGDLGAAAYSCIQKCLLNLDSKMAAGIYRSLILVAPAACFAGAGVDVTNIRINARGKDVHKAVPPDVVIDNYRLAVCNAENAPVIDIINGTSGLGWVADSAHYTCIPLIWGSRNPQLGKLTEAVDTGNDSLSLHLQGALAAGTANFVGRRIQQLGFGDAQARLRKMGIDPSRVVLEPKTFSKVPINPRRITTQDNGTLGFFWKVKDVADPAAAGGYADSFRKV